MKIGIVGSGISGISAASLLQSKGHDVTVFEKEEQIGGLIQCDMVDGNLFHKVGGHVFNSKSQRVLDWFWKQFNKEREFYRIKRNAKIWLQNKQVGYPIENYLYQLERDIIELIFKELLSLNSDSQLKPTNFQEFLISRFGPTLYNLYFKPYNEKIWAMNLKNISLDWLDGKLPMPNLEEIILSNVLQIEESKMVHSHFYYPKNGGSQFIIDRLANDVNVTLSSEVLSLNYDGNKWIVNENQSFDSIVFTGDIRNLSSVILTKDISSRLPAELYNLRSNGTSNLLCYTDNTDLSWLYIPEKEFKAHRIIYTGNFSPSNNAKIERKTCVVEFSGKVSDEIMFEDIKKLPGNLMPIKSNSKSSSYVIQDKITRSLISDAKNILQPYRLYLCGRFAEWEYYNMDKAIEAAMNLSDQLT